MEYTQWQIAFIEHRHNSFKYDASLSLLGYDKINCIPRLSEEITFMYAAETRKKLEMKISRRRNARQLAAHSSRFGERTVSSERSLRSKCLNSWRN